LIGVIERVLAHLLFLPVPTATHTRRPNGIEVRRGPHVRAADPPARRAEAATLIARSARTAPITSARQWWKFARLDLAQCFFAPITHEPHQLDAIGKNQRSEEHTSELR